MAILTILTLLTPFVFGQDYYPLKDPCDCYSIDLKYGYPKVTGDKVCYRYIIEKTDDTCPGTLDYYILSKLCFVNTQNAIIHINKYTKMHQK